MGKGTDKLYITHSEWASEDAFSASAGSRVSAAKTQANAGASRSLPFNYCALSLQPFREPVCTADGTIFDLSHILSWLVKESTNPVDKSPLSRSDLVTLHFTKNDDDEYVDPVTYKAFTENTHLVALRTTGNVFAWDTIEKLNVKTKNWFDLVSDQPFTRKDIITLQDPHNAKPASKTVGVRPGSSVAANPDGADTSSSGINAAALGSSARVLKAREAVEQARRKRQDGSHTTSVSKPRPDTVAAPSHPVDGRTPSSTGAVKKLAHYTTGQAAASFTSTGLTPHTEANLAALSEEESLLRPHTVKTTGFVRIETSVGDITFELFPEYAPRAVWNFIKLAEKGYYKSIPFHRNIRNFMIQGGDPTGTGRGGSSVWNKPFVDEVDGPLSHSSRGVLSMANKGKDTNTSQFFITYKDCKHLDKKHTIFGRLVGESDKTSLETLRRLEDAAPESQPDGSSSSSSNNSSAPVMRDVVVLIDPFAEYTKSSGRTKQADGPTKAARLDDDTVTWTGKTVRSATAAGRSTKDNHRGQQSGGTGVGRYLQSAVDSAADPHSSTDLNPVDNDNDDGWANQPTRKKVKTSGFGNFSGW